MSLVFALAAGSMSISMSPCRQPALPTRKFWEQDLSGQVPDIRSRVVFEKVGTPLTHAPGRLMRGVRTYIYIPAPDSTGLLKGCWARTGLNWGPGSEGVGRFR